MNIFPFLKPRNLYIRATPNRIYVWDIDTDKRIEHIPKLKYHNGRLLISSFLNFEQELRKAVIQLPHNKWFTPPINLIFQPSAPFISEHSNIEKRVYRDS